MTRRRHETLHIWGAIGFAAVVYAVGAFFGLMN
jgi:hypothetical protein